MDMIRNDPSILDDIAGFLKRMNEKNIKQVLSVKTVVADEVLITSIAKLNGGEATQQDIDTALALLMAEPLKQEALARLDKVVAAIDSGEISDSEAMTAKFSEALDGN